MSEAELRAALRVLLAELRMPVRFGLRAPRVEFLPVADWTPLDHAEVAMVRDYRLWCERRHKPSDCLELLGSRSVLSEDDKYKIAFDIALGAEWEGFVGELRGMADPTVVRVVLLGAMVAYMGALAFPEVVTKGIAAAATVVLTAYLGAETVWNLVYGWIQMVGEVRSAVTFERIRAAGERYVKVIGAQTARVLVMVVTSAMAEAARFFTMVTSLPNAARASMLLGVDTGGKLGLADLPLVSGVRVAESGVTVVLSPAAESARQAVGLAMAGTPRGGARGSKDCDEKPERHHIATPKNTKAEVRGGPWTPLFEQLFAKAGMSMEDEANQVLVQGHQGPHPEEYHKAVFGRLDRAMRGCRSIEVYRAALVKELRRLSAEVAMPGSDLNKLVTRGCGG